MIRILSVPLLVLTLPGLSLVRGDENPIVEIRPLREYRGETSAAISGPVPDEVILAESAYQAAGSKLGLAGMPGPVDFAKEVVFLATTRGSRMGLRIRVENDQGLLISAMATRDLRPGLRYVFAVFSKQEWKSMNGTIFP